MSDHYVYGLFRPDTGSIFYIGLGKGARAWQHAKTRKRGRSYKDNIICKLLDDHGHIEIPVVMFREGLTRAAAAELEIALIEAIGRYPRGPLANIVRGGEGLVDPTSEFRIRHGARMKDALGDPAIRKLMSQKAKARERTPEFEAKRIAASHSPESTAKRIAARKGKPSPKKGKHYSGSERGKLVQGQLGWITNGIEQTRVKKTAPIPPGWRRGRLPATAAAREAMSKAGRPPQTAEQRRLQSERQRGRVMPWLNTPEVQARAASSRKQRTIPPRAP